MNNEGTAPYVISADLETVSGDYLIPSAVDDFRSSLTADLANMGKHVEWVEFSELKQGMRQLVNDTHLSVISLDDRYVETSNNYLGISRSVDESLEDAGYDGRIGHEPVKDQLDRVAVELHGQEVVLVDDVVFSGENACWLTEQLADRGVRVRAIVAGVAIGGEAEERLEAYGVDLSYVRLFPEVEDEVCERDFAFVTGSGRKVNGKQQSALYFDSVFGKPAQWASIAEAQVDEFCIASIVRNTALIRGDYPMDQIADFLGYDCNQTVGQCLASALTQRQQAA